MNEILARCAGTFKPKSAADFIGKNIIERANGVVRTGAHLIALHIERAAALAKSNGNAPMKFLYAGEPGIGKSELVKYLQHLTGCNQWNTTQLNGTQCKIERIEELAGTLHLSNLFGDYRLLWIDEADEIPRVAQVRFLTLLDNLPKATIVACTSNCSLKNFEDRFQSRFQVFELCAPAPEEISAFLNRLAPEIPMPDACDIARFANGNVRQALLDAQGILQGAATGLLKAA